MVLGAPWVLGAPGGGGAVTSGGPTPAAVAPAVETAAPFKAA